MTPAQRAVAEEIAAGHLVSEHWPRGSTAGRYFRQDDKRIRKATVEALISDGWIRPELDARVGSLTYYELSDAGKRELARLRAGAAARGRGGAAGGWR